MAVVSYNPLHPVELAMVYKVTDSANGLKRMLQERKVMKLKLLINLDLVNIYLVVYFPRRSRCTGLDHNVTAHARNLRHASFHA